MKATQRLHSLGQSRWVDNVTPDLLAIIEPSSPALKQTAQESLVSL
jgi:hypothetical protein